MGSNSTWKDKLSPQPSQPLDVFAITNTTCKEKGRRNCFQRPSSIMAPHTGQSSQLFADAYDRSAQFLPKLARAVAWNMMHKSFKSPEASPQWTIFATRFGHKQRNAQFLGAVRKVLGWQVTSVLPGSRVVRSRKSDGRAIIETVCRMIKV